MDDYWNDDLIGKDDLIEEIISLYPETISFLEEIGMHCLTCPSKAQETLRMACRAHGLDVGKVAEELNHIVTG